MTLRYVVLQKKLQELESQLHELFHHHNSSPDDIAVEDGHTSVPHSRQLLAEDSVNRKLAFLKSLVLAEMESHTNKKPGHLLHIAERLEVVESAFVQWATAGTIPSNGLDNLSPCYCTESCFVDEEKEEEMERPAQSCSDPCSENPLNGTNSDFYSSLSKDGVKAEVERVEKNPRFKSMLIGMVGAVVLLLLTMAVIINNCFESDENTLLVPT